MFVLYQPLHTPEASGFFWSWLNRDVVDGPATSHFLCSRHFTSRQSEYKFLLMLVAVHGCHVIFASSHNILACWLFAKTFFLPFQNHYVKLTLKMSDDWPWVSPNWVSPGAGLWLPVCSCFLDLSYIAIFASSRLVLLFSCRKYVWVGKVVWSCAKNQEQPCSVF